MSTLIGASSFRVGVSFAAWMLLLWHFANKKAQWFWWLHVIMEEEER